MDFENAQTQPKVIAIVSYLTFVGLAAAYILNQKSPSKLGAFHIRQSLGITLGFVVAKLFMMVPGVGWISALGLIGLSFVGWVVGLISATQEKEDLAPIVGEYFQEWFASIE